MVQDGAGCLFKVAYNVWQYEIVLKYEAQTCRTAANFETRENI